MTRSLICAAALLALGAAAQSTVTVTVDDRAAGAAIPDDFVGLSFGMKSLLANKAGARFFSATNKPLVTLFQNLGLRRLRVGGTTVESPPATPIPNESDIDSLFAFAHAAGVNKIIYSLRLLESDPARSYLATNIAIARYIWSRYQPALECFALGNEPDRSSIYRQDLTIKDFATYMVKWKKFADAIANAVPGARFAGPDAGSGNVNWTVHFTDAVKNSGLVPEITEHFYAGGAGKGVEPSQGIDDMLSAEWVKRNQTLFNQVAAPVLADGLAFRFTEANDHYSGGVPGASDTFTGSLWALDFLHWWAGHKVAGVDFHNTQWVVSDVIAPDSNSQLNIKPKGYGIKAFDLGSHGRPAAVTMANPDGLNLTAYAVRGNDNLFVTIINKTYGAGAKEALATIVAKGTANRAEAIFLTAPNGDVTAKTGVTLGGAAITGDGSWLGKWSPVEINQAGCREVKVAPASAVIVKIAIAAP